jgi:EF-hand domain pair
MKILSILTLAVITETSVPQLMAQSEPSTAEAKKKRLVPAGEVFRKHDKDENGKISKSEFLTLPRIQMLKEKLQDAIFTRLDQNKDGDLSRDEIREMHRAETQRREEKFRKLDTDGSGGLSYSEMNADLFFSKLPDEKRREIFQRMDTDGNGEINTLDRPKHRKQGR